MDGWHDVLRAYAKQFGISKLENVVSGGKNGQDSIRNGLYDIAERYKNDDDVVLIHDAIRPMVSADVITDNIRVCRQYGNAITVVPCTAAMLKTYDALSTVEQEIILKLHRRRKPFFLRIFVTHIRKHLIRELQILLHLVRCTLNLEENFICRRGLRKI